MIEISESHQIHIFEIDTGEQIRLLRKSLKLSQQEFADILGVNKLCISRWENDIRKCKGSALILMNILTKYNLWQKELNDPS